MTAQGADRSLQIAKPDAERDAFGSEDTAAPHSEKRHVHRRHLPFQAVWFVVNLLLILSILVAAYSAVWEYSTRRYLKGFADAVVPASATAEQKVGAILGWMSSGPTRLESDPTAVSLARDPVETLNYAALLRVCGSATNAFVNLADSAELTARRLLLLDSHRMTKHVVAEVLIGDRWIVVDPAFRVIFRDASGRPMTRQELADPASFAAATGGIRGYNPAYTFDRTAHIRLSRLGLVGQPFRYALDHLLPGWEDSATMTLVVERESFTALVASIALAVFLILVRMTLRWYGSKFGIHPPLARERLLQACAALFSAPD